VADADGGLSGAAAVCRHATAPGLGLDIEVVEIGELSGRKEVVAHVADGEATVRSGDDGRQPV